MTLDDSEEALKHLRRVVSLAERLRLHSIAVYTHQYNYLAFGSWSLVAGNRHRRVQLTWDGKEFVLSCAASEFGGSSAPASWRPLESKHLEGADAEEIARAAVDFAVRGLREGAA
ncbi:MAG: hypothetical protein DMD54_04765 [Gemmatimonadetes bacterium]|nr:MAG: hypothetical protein DMD54_04765 [Gemmatimonadota bacterium]